MAAPVREVEVERISRNPHQPRASEKPEALQELADSIRQHGIIQPLIVTESDGGNRYQLIAGERRLEAAKLAGMSTVPVVVREATPQQMLELALIENLQRADLNPIEEASAYRHLMDDFGLTQEQVAARVGKNRVTVANSVRLLRLPHEVQQAIIAGQISEGHARALLRLERAADQKKAVQMILARGLSVRQTEALAQQLLEGRLTRKQVKSLKPADKALEDKFRQVLGTKVRLARNARGGGTLVIHFYSEEELENIYRAIVG